MTEFITTHEQQIADVTTLAYSIILLQRRLLSPETRQKPMSDQQKIDIYNRTRNEFISNLLRNIDNMGQTFVHLFSHPELWNTMNLKEFEGSTITSDEFKDVVEDILVRY